MKTAHYQTQLNSLRELAVEFAEKHPALAPQLSGPSPDPDVERILEGVAFLTGNIRERLDDDFSEFSQSLMQLVFPHYLRPLPSSTIMRFTPKSILKTALDIPANTFVDSESIEDTQCRFRTCYDVSIAPVAVSGVRLSDNGRHKKIFEAKLSLNGISFSDWSGDSLRFYIGGDFVGAVDTWMLLLNHTASIDILSDGGVVKTLPKTALRPIGFDDSSAMIPFPSNSFPAYRLIQEYFLFKEKFLFLELTGLADIGSSNVVLKFHLDQVDFATPRITPDRFLLHSTPAVNLFSHDAEPIRNDNRQSELRVKPGKGRSRGDQTHYHIYSIDSVTGHNRKAAKETVYSSINMFNALHTTEPVYQVTQRSDDDNRITEPYISFSYPVEHEIADKETLSISLTCTNGSLPSKLRPGDICKATSSTSELVEFGNLTPPTEQQQPPTGGSLLWRLLSHLSLNYLSLADSENLKALLGLYIFPGGSSPKEVAINQKRVDGIQKVSVRAEDQLVRGDLLRGQVIDIGLDRDYYASNGDMYLFATMLERLFNSFSSINCYTQLKVTDTSTGHEYIWPAKLGTRSLL